MSVRKCEDQMRSNKKKKRIDLPCYFAKHEPDILLLRCQFQHLRE